MIKPQFFGAALLIAGTCVGAGMLALPVATSPIGFYGSIILFIAVWLFMCFTGLLVLEVNLWLPKHTSFISMSRQTLGRAGQVVTWGAFLLLLYSLLTAYVMGGGALVVAVEELYLRHPVQPWLSYLPWIVVFAVIIYCGTRLSDLLNRLLILGLIISFAALSTALTSHVKISLFNGFNYRYILVALPIIFTSFGYHIVLPTIRDYLGSTAKTLRHVVILGSLIPLCLYIFWNFLIFGVVPLHGPNGLLSILQTGQPTDLLTKTVSNLTNHFWIDTAARFFVFFAIASSFVGVSVGLFDLLADGLKIKKTQVGRGILSILTFAPPVLFAMSYPKGFLLALGYAGALVALLHGILPAAMVWSGRYHLKIAQGYRVAGGRFALLFVFLISLIVIFAQLGMS